MPSLLGLLRAMRQLDASAKFGLEVQKSSFNCFLVPVGHGSLGIDQKIDFPQVKAD